MKRFIYTLVAFFIFATSIYFTGCSSNFSYSFSQENGVLSVGQKVNIYDYLTLENEPKTIVWKSSNTDVLTIDESGIVYAINKGIANISTTIYETDINFSIEVIQNVIELSMTDTLSLETDQLYLIDATIYPSNANNKKIIWTSSNEDIASVQNGVIRTKTEGQTIITAKTEDKNEIKSCILTVKWNGLTAQEVESENGIYKISSARQLKWMANQIYDSVLSQVSIELTTDIDLNNKEWLPIGNSTNREFTGIINGNGHFINNLRITSASPYCGFVAINKGIIKNLTINGNIEINDSSSSTYCGSIAGYSDGGQILACNSNCNTTINQKSSDGCFIGGIIGYSNNSKITNCNNYSNLTGTTKESIFSFSSIGVSGITNSNPDTQIMNCINYGDLICYSKSNEEVLAGISISNTSEDSAFIYNCRNLGQLTLLNKGTSFQVSNKDLINKSNVSSQNLFDAIVDMDLLDNIIITGTITISNDFEFGIETSITIAETGTLAINNGSILTVYGTFINNGTISISGTQLYAYNHNFFDESTYTIYATDNASWSVLFVNESILNLEQSTVYAQNGVLNLLSSTNNSTLGTEYETAINYCLANNNIIECAGKVLE